MVLWRQWKRSLRSRNIYMTGLVFKVSDKSEVVCPGSWLIPSLVVFCTLGCCSMLMNVSKGLGGKQINLGTTGFYSCDCCYYGHFAADLLKDFNVSVWIVTLQEENIHRFTGTESLIFPELSWKTAMALGWPSMHVAYFPFNFKIWSFLILEVLSLITRIR